MSLISSWFEEETEQERQTEYRAPSPIIQRAAKKFYAHAEFGHSGGNSSGIVAGQAANDDE